MFRNLTLKTRFTVFVLLATIPLLLISLLVLNSRAAQLIRGQADRTLGDANFAIANDTSTWLEQQQRALQQTANLPDVVSMDPLRQRDALIAMAKAHPNLYLVHTLDENGFNVARNDDAELKDYSDRNYFRSALSGEPISYDVVIGKTSGQPALILAVPIIGENSNIVGVVSIASLLDNISQITTATDLGETGVSFIVDNNNRIVTHPDPAYTTGELQDFSEYPPVMALRQGREGLIDFIDANNVKWRAYISRINNGWGIIVQQKENELLAPVRAFHAFTLIMTLIGLAALVVFSSIIASSMIAPIQVFKDTARSIAQGNFEQRIPVKNKDEIGQLSEAFNAMASQVQSFVTSLEKRVEERTAELEQANQQVQRRAQQFEAIAQVSRIISSIKNQEDLLRRVTRTISQHFGYYHVGIFLLDENKQYAILRAANSEGGLRMLERGHRLGVGQTGIVGYVTATGNPRIALDTGADAVYFDNPDLPEPRSEMALPLMIDYKVSGALDVQSTEPNAFSNEDISIITMLADQVSAALENARLHEDAQEALSKAETAYRQLTGVAWTDIRRFSPVLGYRFDGKKAEPLNKPTNSVQTESQKEAFTVPVQLRGASIGSLRIRAASDGHQWSDDEIAIIQATAERVALAAENARLVSESQKRASKEQIIGEASSKVSSAINLDNILQTALREMGRILPGAEISIQVENE